jgi:hypothetical protein
VEMVGCWEIGSASRKISHREGCVCVSSASESECLEPSRNPNLCYQLLGNPSTQGSSFVA